MGVQTFCDVAKGKDAKEAFRDAVQQAQYDHGHAGYTGTIAEKREFIMIEVPNGQDARAYADKLLRDHDKRICDKWGPAGCVSLGNGVYYFFGWASS